MNATVEETTPEAISESWGVVNGASSSFPVCPKCGRPIINETYCINCGTFIKKLPNRGIPIKRRYPRR